MRHLQMSVAALFLSLSASAAPAQSGPPILPGGDGVTPVRGVGCYWEWGRLYCSRYCYVEVNGRQYCHPRLRHAHSNAPVVHVYPAEIKAPRRQRLK